MRTIEVPNEIYEMLLIVSEDMKRPISLLIRDLAIDLFSAIDKDEVKK